MQGGGQGTGHGVTSSGQHPHTSEKRGGGCETLRKVRRETTGRSGRGLCQRRKEPETAEAGVRLLCSRSSTEARAQSSEHEEARVRAVRGSGPALWENRGLAS